MRRAEVEFALQHPDIFSSAMEAVDLGQIRPPDPAPGRPARSLKYRKLLDPIFAPKQMNLIEPDIARLVNELIDAFIDDGSCEFTTALAEPLPSSVFLRLLGLPVSELDMFLSMKNGILRPAGDRHGGDAGQSAVQRRPRSSGYFAEALADRRKASPRRTC